MPQVWIVGEPDDIRALIRNDSVNRIGQERASPRSRGRSRSRPKRTDGSASRSSQAHGPEACAARLPFHRLFVRGCGGGEARQPPKEHEVGKAEDKIGLPLRPNRRCSSAPMVGRHGRSPAPTMGGGVGEMDSSGSPGKGGGECAEVREAIEPATPQCIAGPSGGGGECAKVREAIEPATSQDAKTQGPGLSKTLAIAGLQANPRGGWPQTGPRKGTMWADMCSDGEGVDIFSDGESDSGDNGRPKSAKLRQSDPSEAKIAANEARTEQLKKRIRDLGSEPDAAITQGILADLQELREPTLPPRKMRSHEFKAKKGGGLEIVEAKGKKNKGGRAGQQRAQRQEPQTPSCT